MDRQTDQATNGPTDSEEEQVFIVSKQQDDLDSRTIPTPQ